MPKGSAATVEGKPLKMIGEGKTVGTSSVRRLAQLKLLRTDLNITDVRGNLNTRLKKLLSGQYDALVLACAGLDRLPKDTTNVLEKKTLEMAEKMPEDHFEDLLAKVDIFPIESSELMPAIGQGTLALETRANDFGLNTLFKRTLDHYETRRCSTQERQFLRAMEGGCQVPMGVMSLFDPAHDKVMMDAHVYPKSDISTNIIKVEKCDKGGKAAADMALAHGAKKIVDMWRQN